MLTDQTGYITGYTNAGIIRCDGGAILIDNGWGVKEGRNILAQFEQNALQLVAIVNTHTHIDHGGANAFLQKETGCHVYTTLFESLLLQGYPLLFSMMFTGTLNPILDGLEPVSNLTKVEHTLFEAGETLHIGGVDLKTVDLAGHSYGQVGIVYDNILFCGDAVMDEESMKKSKLTFLTNPTQQRKTLDYIKHSKYDWYVPSHGTHFSNPAATCDLYFELIDHVEQDIFEITKKPAIFEDILAFVAKNLNIDIHQFVTYCTCKDAVGAILTELVKQQKLTYSFQDNRMYFHAI